MSRNYVLEDNEASPGSAMEENEPGDVELQEAMAELNALTVRVDATKAQQAKWQKKMSADRKRLIESLRQAVYHFDKQKAALKKPATPPKLPKTIAATEQLSPVPVSIAIANQPEPSPNPPVEERIASPPFGGSASVRGHMKVKRLRSSPELSPSFHHESPSFLRGSSRISATLEEQPENTSGGEETATTATAATTSVVNTSRSHVALGKTKSVTLDLRHSDAMVAPESTPATDTARSLATNNSADLGIPTVISQTSARNEPENHTSSVAVVQPPPPSVPLREIIETPTNVDFVASNTHLIRNKSTTPHLMIADKPSSRSDAMARGRTPPRFVHRATALDLDEIRQMAQRTFQRQLLTPPVTLNYFTKKQK